MIRLPISLVLSALFLCISCGESDKKLTIHDKTATIAILEDSRDMGRGELLEYLSDPDPETRVRAVQALGRIEWPGTAIQIARLLADSVESVRLETAFALGQLQDSNSIFPLVDHLRTEASVDVKCALIEALGKIGNPVTSSTITSFATDPDPRIRSHVALALSHLQKHGSTRDLIELSRDSVDDVQWKAVFALSRTGDSTAIGRLRWCLKDSVDLMRQYAARGLDMLQDSASLRNLTDRLRREKDDMVKATLIRTIGHVGDRKALKSLLNVLSGKNRDHIKAEAIAAIGMLKLDKAFAKLTPFLDDENRVLQRNAIVAIAKVNPDYFMENVGSYLDGADWFIKFGIIDGLAAVGTEQAYAMVVELLGDSDVRVRRKALDAMIAFESEDVIDHAAEALDHPDFSVAITAIGIIDSLKDRSFTEQMADAYDRHARDEDPDLRLTVVETFSKWVDSTSPDPKIVDLFNLALEDSDYLVREAAVAGFLKIGEDRSSKLGHFETDITYDNYANIYERWTTNPKAVIKTNRGSIKVELLYDVAPKTVANFVDLVTSGFYDQKIWHRVIPAFVIQAGCPRGDGWGGPGYTIRCEYNRKRYSRGTMGMARAGKDTGGSQIFIAHTALPHLDGRYTAFGQVISGMRVVDRIMVGDSIRTIEITE